jgi:hypothetical protein
MDKFMPSKIRYFGGEEIRLGDRVCLADDPSGIVVYIIDTGEGDLDNPAGSWDHLESGVMILFSKYGLHHYINPDEEPDLSLISRRN